MAANNGPPAHASASASAGLQVDVEVGPRGKTARMAHEIPKRRGRPTRTHRIRLGVEIDVEIWRRSLASRDHGAELEGPRQRGDTAAKDQGRDPGAEFRLKRRGQRSEPRGQREVGFDLEVGIFFF